MRFTFGGLFDTVMPLLYKIPITGGHSIIGAAFLATVTSHFSYSQLIGGYTYHLSGGRSRLIHKNDSLGAKRSDRGQLVKTGSL